MKWVTHVSLYLVQLGNSCHSVKLEKVTITWHIMDTYGAFLHQSSRWLELEDLFASLPGLSKTTMILDAVSCLDSGLPPLWRDSGDHMTNEDYAREMRTVWKHPRCFSHCGTTTRWSTD